MSADFGAFSRATKRDVLSRFRSALDMMRYQRVSPDCLPLRNGPKPNLRTSKKEDSDSGVISNCNGFEGKPLKLRPGSTPSTSQDHNFSQFLVSDSFQSENHIVVKQENGSGGDILLQWGQKKRSRGSRAEKQMIKIQRRVVVSGVEKSASNQTAMLPPCTSRSLNHRHSMPVPETTGTLLCRNMEERSLSGSGPQSGNGNRRVHIRSAEKRSPRSPEKVDKMASCSATAVIDEKPKGLSVLSVQAEPITVQSTPQSQPEACVATEKINLNLFEWPRIYIALSRKEKEDDFLAIKGTKLPQRPKKRAKNVDKTLQYCFPGMWLSDLTRSRYEVREKKCVKKRRRGLKGMESMDSDSE